MWNSIKCFGLSSDNHEEALEENGKTKLFQFDTIISNSNYEKLVQIRLLCDRYD